RCGTSAFQCRGSASARCAGASPGASSTCPTFRRSAHKACVPSLPERPCNLLLCCHKLTSKCCVRKEFWCDNSCNGGAERRRLFLRRHQRVRALPDKQARSAKPQESQSGDGSAGERAQMERFQ